MASSMAASIANMAVAARGSARKVGRQSDGVRAQNKVRWLKGWGRG